MKRIALILSGLLFITVTSYAQCAPDASISPAGLVTLCPGNSVTITAPTGDVWMQIADLAGAGRRNAVAFNINAKGYLGTGRNASNPALKDFWEYDPTNNVWTQKADLGGTARYGAVGFSIGTKGYVATGSSLASVYLNDFWEYDPTTNVWALKANFTGAARMMAVGFGIGSKGYIGTGFDGTTYFADLREYNPVTDAWSVKASFPGGGRSSAIGFATATRGYLGTGAVSAVSFENDLYEYNPGTNTWVVRADMPGAARYGAAAFSIGTRGFVGLGFSTIYLKDFYEFDPGANSWTVRANYGGPACHYASGFAIGASGYFSTGFNGTTYNNACWEYHPSYSYLWSTNASSQSISVSAPGNYAVTVSSVTGCTATSDTTIVNVPEATVTPSGTVNICPSGSVTLTASNLNDVWTRKADLTGLARQGGVGFSIGAKGYIGTGEITGLLYSKDLWEYDAATGAWMQKADFGGVARIMAVGFSINSKGYIGLGKDATTTLKKDFWEYNPVSNIWLQKSDFPGTARSGAIGFSIGTKGYVGTGDDGTRRKDFWEYNPATNLWAAKANFGGTARREAIAFAIGTKGYVGTGNDGSFTKDFWEYNPTTNLWSQKADFGASARYAAVGFNIGSKGYIGTGFDGSSKDDFWEYSPATDAWVQRAIVGGLLRASAVGFSIGLKGYIGTGLNPSTGFSKELWEYSPPITYLWSSGQTTSSIITSTPGSYSVSITDVFGCTTTSAATTVNAPMAGTYTVGIGGNYTTLTAAVNAYNTACALAGPIIFEMIDNTYPSETFPITINLHADASVVNTLTIRPSSTSLPLITASSVTQIINLNGAKYITFDGRQGGAGTTKSLTISNTNASGVAVQFINDAQNDYLKYCNIQGRRTSATSGTIVFSTANASGTGNDNNTIDNNDISEATGGFSNNAIYSAGTAGRENDSISITNNNISNYYNAGLSSAGVFVNSNSSSWNITRNRFFQTATRYTGVTSNYGINISAGSGYTISNNIIGFSNSAGTGTTNMVGYSIILAGFPGSYSAVGGSAFAIRYAAIYVNLATVGTATSIDGNTIGGFAMFTSSNAATSFGMFCGIDVESGTANIGAVAGNIIGAAAGNNSIYVATTTAGGTIMGIRTNSNGDVTIQNNIIGSITSSGTAATVSGSFTGINMAGVCNYMVSNNSIGNANADNLRIGYALSGASLSNAGALTATNVGVTANFKGISCSSTGNMLSITNNTIQGWAMSCRSAVNTGIETLGVMTGVSPSINVNNNFFGTAATNWINSTVDNNSSFFGVTVANTGATTYNIKDNDFRGAIFGIQNSVGGSLVKLAGADAANAIATISGNTFTNPGIHFSSGGTVYFIFTNYSISSTGQLIIDNNKIVGTFSTSGFGQAYMIYNLMNVASGSKMYITNNDFSNLVALASSTTATGLLNNLNGGSCILTVTNNKFNNWTSVNGSMTGIIITNVGGTVSCSNNTISNIATTGSITGLQLSSTVSSGQYSLANNTISGLASSSSAGGLVAGILISIPALANTTQTSIDNNVISGLSCTSSNATVQGIYFDNGHATSTISVSKNKIYDISESGSGGFAYGIYNSATVAGNITYSNNYIGDLRAPNSNAFGPSVAGMKIAMASGQARVYYNTIHLNVTGSGTNFSTAAVYTDAAVSLTLHNNIFSNVSTPGSNGITVAFWRSGINLSLYDATSNNNIFYAGTASARNLIFYDYSNSDLLFEAYQLRVGPTRDAESFSELPPFLSTSGSSANFLHLDPSVQTLAESGAANIAGYIDDFDAQIRQGNAGYTGTGTAPDIGADEGEFLSAFPCGTSPMIGIYTISTAPASCTNFTSFQTAIRDLNRRTIAGNVRFDVAAGFTETVPAGGLILGNAALNAATAGKTITFIKNGSGANPLLTAYTGFGTPASNVPDVIFSLSGIDNVIIDAIDLVDNNATNPQTMEMGYGLFKRNNNDGVNGVTILNCNISLNRINNLLSSPTMFEGSTGIMMLNTGRYNAVSAFVPSATSGANSNNKFYSNIITNVNNGIGVNGYAATISLGDRNNDIGGNSAATGNRVLNFGGGGANSSAGVRFDNQWDANIGFNAINNNNGAGINHPGTLRGIFTSGGSDANVSIINNDITVNGGGTTQSVYGIDNNAGNAGLSNSLNIVNNTVTGTYSTATSGSFNAIYNSSTAVTLNMSGNTVQNCTYGISLASSSGQWNGIYNSLFNTYITMSDNFLINNAIVSSGALTGITAAFGGINMTMNNNTISGNTKTNSTSTKLYWLTLESNSTTNSSFNSNTITDNYVTGAISNIDISGINIGAGSASTYTANFNTIRNIGMSNLAANVTVTVSGIRNNFSGTSETISNNTIHNLFVTGVSTSLQVVQGVYLNTSGSITKNIQSNSIDSLYTSSGLSSNIYGIRNKSGTAVNIFRNKIFSLIPGQSVAGSYAAGIRVESGTGLLYNNMIGIDYTGTSANGIITNSDGLKGIENASTTGTYSLYFNSIHLKGSGSTGFGSSGIGITSATPGTVLLRNNIIDNQASFNGSGISVGLRRAVTSLTAYDGTSSNNCWYAGTASANNLLYYDGTAGGSYQTLAAFQTAVSPRETKSISETTNWIAAPSNLHLDPNNCEKESGAIPIAGITLDYDSIVRDATNPDMGADEFDGTGTTTWKGINSDWMDVKNWCSVLPTSSSNIIIPAGKSFYPIITTTGPVTNDLNIASGGSVTVTGIGQMGIYGTIINSGTFDAADGAIELAGSAPQTIPDNCFQNNDLKNLIINNALVNLADTLNLYGKLSFTGGSRVFATADNLVLRSNAAGTAWVADMTNNNTNTGNDITGNVTVERFINTGTVGSQHLKSWQFLATPTTGQTIFQSWQEAGSVPAGFGTWLTGTGTGFDVTTVLPSIKYYNSAANNWTGVVSTSAPLLNKLGYMLFVRGDRTVTAYNALPNNTNMRSKGTLFTPLNPPPPVAVSANSFQSFGNPYASRIAFTKVRTASTGINDVFYVWDPKLSGSNNYGGYQTVSGITGYLPTPGGATTYYQSADPVLNIESGQAVFVRGNLTGGNVNFTETCKADSSHLVNKFNAANNNLVNRQFLFANLYTGTGMIADGNAVAFENGFGNEINEDDALKILNVGENFGIMRNDTLLAIEARSCVVNSDTIFYNIRNLLVQDYQFRFAPVNMQPDLTAFLIDRFSNTSISVSITDSSFVNFSITADPGSYAMDRFILVFKQASVVPVKFIQIAASRNSDQAAIIVQWITGNEINLQQYEVERSGDGRNFIAIGQSAPLGNNGNDAAYIYKDEQPLNGDNFYRIKAIAMDGQKQYSKIVKVDPVKVASSITVFPNPVVDNKINIHFLNQPAGNYYAQLTNKLSQVVYSNSFFVDQVNAIKTITTVTKLAAGTYQLIVTANDGNKILENIFVQ